MIPPVLLIDDLHVGFGRHMAVRGLTFAVRERETVALVGESGSGKSATALAVMRLIERDGGRIAGGRIVLDAGRSLDLTALAETEMRGVRGNLVSMVFQEPMTSLNPVLTIGDQLAEVFMQHRAMAAREALKAAEEALERVRIPDPRRRLTQYPHQLSGGLRQRVMIAMAVGCRPKLLIADEPTTALDVTTQAEILDLVRQLQAEFGTAVLFITHDMGVVAEIADRVVVLRDGVKEEEAPVHDLFHRPKAAYSRKLIAATPRLGSGAPKLADPREPVLSVERLNTSFPLSRGMLRRAAVVHAVNNVSFSVGEGETLGLVGESGCGKSTLARSVLRLIEPSSGTIRLAGVELVGLPSNELRQARRDAQMIFQDPFASLNPRLPVHELVSEPARIHNIVTARGQRDLAASLVEKVGLEADCIDRYPHQFSGGQRQRLCIARALSAKPRIVIADEPVSALDVSIARQVTDLLLELQQAEGLAFLFISHDMAVVERVSHRIAVMLAGEIVETGPTNAVLHNPRHPYTRRLLSAVPKPDPSIKTAAREVEPKVGHSIVRAIDELRAERPLLEMAPGHFVRSTTAA